MKYSVGHTVRHVIARNACLLFDSSSQIQGQCIYGEQHLKSAYMNIMGQNNQLTELAIICASVMFVIIYNAKGKLHQTGASRH